MRKPTPIPKNSRGVLSLLVLVALAFFGATAGIQVLLHASAGLSSRALDLSRQRLAAQRTVEQALGEWLRRVAEGNATAAAQSPASGLASLFSELGVDATLEKAPASVPVPESFPSVKSPVLRVPSAKLLVHSGPEARNLFGARVDEESLGVFGVAVRGFGQAEAWHLDYEARRVAVPLPRKALTAYVLPGDMGATSTRLHDSRFEMLGLLGEEAGTETGALQSASSSLPYHFRGRLAEARAYLQLFSQETIDWAAMVAGTDHVLNLSEAALSAPKWAGFVRGVEVDTFDLSKAGVAEAAGVARTGSRFVIYGQPPGRILRLVDQGGTGSGQPLTLVLVGSPANPLRVELGNITRPILLLASGVLLRPDAGARVCGVVLLSPDCEMPALIEPCHVVALACHALSTKIETSAVVADLELGEELRALLPAAQQIVLLRNP